MKWTWGSPSFCNFVFTLSYTVDSDIWTHSQMAQNGKWIQEVPPPPMSRVRRRFDRPWLSGVESVVSLDRCYVLLSITTTIMRKVSWFSSASGLSMQAVLSTGLTGPSNLSQTLSKYLLLETTEVHGLFGQVWVYRWPLVHVWLDILVCANIHHHLNPMSVEIFRNIPKIH